MGWVEGDDIRCRYHGWKYDPSGQCVEQPAELQPFCEKVRIQSYQTQEYLGLIFIYMGEGETPPLPRYPEVEGEGVLEVVKPNLSESNYFRRIEQIGDEAHHLFAHRRETPHSKFGLQPVMVTETEYGMLQTATFASGVRTRHYLVPNIMYVTNNAALPEETDIRKRFMWKVPVDDDHYWNLGVLFVHLRGEAARRYLDGQAEREAESERADTPGKLKRILAGEMALEEIEDRSDISHLEDEVVLAGIGLCDERPLDEHLAPSDAGVILKRKIWERELRALAEGHPLKEWKRSEVLTVSEGM